MTAHRYWRVNVTSSNGSALCVLVQVQFRIAIGGSTVTTGGAVISADSTAAPWGGASNVFDGTDSSYAYVVATNIPAWIGYDFGSGNDKSIVEVALDSYTDTTTEPVNFTLDYSDNGSTWTTLITITNAETGWSISTRKAFNNAVYDTIPNATALLTGSPLFGTPMAVPHPNCVATSLITGSPRFGTPIASQSVTSFNANTITAGHPIFGVPALNATAQHLAAAVQIIVGNPRFGTPVLAKLFSLPNATQIIIGSPLFGTPTAAQLPTHLTTKSPIFGQPALAQTHALPIAAFITGSPIFGRPSLHQIVSSVILGAYLPSNIEKGAKGGPRFNTSLFIGANGAEYRSVNWPRSVGTWSLSLGFREEDRDNYEDFEQLLNLFYVARGNGYGFLFKDWSDYAAAAQPMAPVPGSPGAMQLQKVYTAGAGSYARKITRPVDGSLVVTLAGVPQSGISYSLNSGIVFGATSDMLASFSFYVPVRFDVDSLEVDVEIDGLVNCPTISLTEILE